jgi:DNA-binding response OmpR family regulator
VEKGLLLTFSTLTDQETRSFLQEHGVPSLAKPFEVADLIAHVRTLSQREGKPISNKPVNQDKAEHEVKSANNKDDRAAAAGAGI